MRAANAGGAVIRWVFVLLLLPGAILALLAMLRVPFARRFWKQLYIIGLVYVAIVLVRLLFVIF